MKLKNIGEKSLKLINNMTNRISKSYYLFGRRNKIKKFLNKINYPDKNNLIDTNNYWKKYSSNFKNYWHIWYYMQNKRFNKYYIPEDIFYSEMVPYLKNISGVFFDDDFNFINLDEKLKEISNQDKLIIKPSIESGAGKSIIVLQENNPAEMYKLLKTEVQQYKENFVIQKYISQSLVIAQMNPSSVNTIRIVTFMFDSKIEILSAHIRVGIDNNSIDQNGVSVGIDNNGITKNEAYLSRKGTKLSSHPQEHNLYGVKIPNFDKIVDIARSEHKKFSHFKIIGWDFAIDNEDNPMLIEFNVSAPGIKIPQLTNGPLFGELTNEVLDHVFGKHTK